jgi:hypothetical protein
MEIREWETTSVMTSKKYGSWKTTGDEGAIQA